MEALFFNFAKRKNSLKVPVKSTGTSFNVVLKEPTSMDAPHLILNADTFGFNYAKFNGQYFFVSDITSRRNNLWEVTLEKDVLATYRAEILATSAYILYDNVGNSEIVDNRLAINTSRTLAQNSVAFPNIDTNIGRYILSCVGRNSSNSWIIPYRMNPSSIVSSVFIQNVYDSIDETPTSWTDASTDTFTAIQEFADLVHDLYLFITSFLKKAWSQLLSSGNALNTIRNCIWLPFTWSTSGSAQSIYLGNYDTGYAAVKAGTSDDPFVIKLPQTVINIPWQYSDWRRNAPYTQVYLYIPFIGVVQLPTSSLTGQASITIQAALNIVSGDLAINVNNDIQVIGSYGANVSVPVPLGSSNITPRQLFNTLIGSLTGAAAAGVGAVNIGAAALSGIASAAMANISGQPTSIGGLSSGAAVGLSTDIICFTICHDTTVAPSSVADVIGLPAFQKKTISTLSGYVQCHEFSLNAAAESGDLDAVNSFMNSGVFIE